METLMLPFSPRFIILTICSVVTALLLYEHKLVKPNDLSRVDAAFFTMNGYVSVLFFVFWASDILFGIKRV